MTVDATDDGIRLGDGFFADPDSLYRELRHERPVVRVLPPNRPPMWMITRYADARAALTDSRLAKDSHRLLGLLGPEGASSEDVGVLFRHMLNADPPDHTRLRKLVGKAFTVRAIQRLRPRIEEIAAGLADAMAAAGPEVDLLDGFAFPLPMTVICELLGVPEGRRDEFRTWSNTLLSGTDVEQRAPAATAMIEFLTELVNAKARRPGDDILSDIVAASEDGDRLSRDEAIAMAMLLLVAGHETTVNLIGNGMLALLGHPEQRDRLLADPDLVPGAVEEFLRWDGPVNLATLRFTTEPVTVGETTIPADEIVLVSLLGANRDPEKYDEADRLDVARDTTGHLAFGHGIHHCLGAPLARLEGEVAFRTLLARFPDMAPAGEPGPFRVSTLIHGLTRFPVRL